MEEMGLTGFTRSAMFKCLSLVAGGFLYPAGVGGGTGGVAGAGGAKGPKPGTVSGELLSENALKFPLLLSLVYNHPHFFISIDFTQFYLVTMSNQPTRETSSYCSFQQYYRQLSSARHWPLMFTNTLSD